MTFLETRYPTQPASFAARSASGDSTLIKGKLHKEYSDGLFPAFSASGQDVWHSEYRHEGTAIILSAVGARCGKCFFATGRWSAIANTHIIWPNTDVADPEYLYFLFNNESFWIRGGSAQPFVKVKASLKQEIPLPSLVEQRRIVARIKECMERVEEIEGLRAESIEETDGLVQSVLHDTWQSDEIASAEKTALGELGQLTTGNTPSRKKPEFFGGSQPWVTPGDFNGRLIATGREYLSEKGITEGRARVVPEGSVLVVCIGATIGKIALAVRDLGINQQINAVTFDKKKVLPEYGYWACRALVPEIIGNASKNTLPILNKGRFSKLEIPVPSLNIQEQVSSRLDAVEASVSEMRRDLSESNTASTVLRESILRKAFAGEL